MTLYKPRTPYSDAIKRPDCPRCGTRMMLSRITPVRDKPDHVSHTFDCPKCGEQISEVAKAP